MQETERWVSYGPRALHLMPVGAKIIHVDYTPTATMTITTLRPRQGGPGTYESRAFEMFPVGSPVPDGATYLGTSVMDDHYGGRLHWHIFELGDR